MICFYSEMKSDRNSNILSSLFSLFASDCLNKSTHYLLKASMKSSPSPTLQFYWNVSSTWFRVPELYYIFKNTKGTVLNLKHFIQCLKEYVCSYLHLQYKSSPIHCINLFFHNRMKLVLHIYTRITNLYIGQWKWRTIYHIIVLHKL